MKKVTKFFMVALLSGIFSNCYSQVYLKNPKPCEKILGKISRYDLADYSYGYSLDYVYECLLSYAKRDYPEMNIDIRNVKGEKHSQYNTEAYSYGEGIIVDITVCLYSQAFDKALQNVPDGSRLAIDIVKSTGEISRNDLKDQVVDLLLDKGYIVVAKDYLEKLYKEQRSQQSGIYNENTIVQEDNFSGVGYFINVKLTEIAINVQIINVSTGEYEGNATVNF